MVCNPPESVRAIVQLAEAAILAGFGLPASDENMATIYAIEAGVCVGVTQLNNLIAWIQNYNKSQAKMALKLKKGAAFISVEPLVSWSKTAK